VTVIASRAKYKLIYADPPWSYYGDPNKPQAAGKHYALMTTDAISRIPVRRWVTKEAACFMWATGPKLPEALVVMNAWGFHFRGVAYVWVKTRGDGTIIHGQGTRPTFVKPTTEFVLAGSTCKTGRPLPLLTEAQGQVVLAPRGAHSEKPPEVRRRIEELFGPVPRLEMFARHSPDDWDTWGNEIGVLD
jgi:N6-adenosine-specific RNA methylase IME4